MAVGCERTGPTAMFEDGELDQKAVVAEYATTAADGKTNLTEKEIDMLNRIVVMFLDQAEFRAQRRQDIKMRDRTSFLDKFLKDTDLPVLEGAIAVSRENAIFWAETQYGAFIER